MKALIYCNECGKQMVLKPKKVGIPSYNRSTGKKQRYISNQNYPEEMIKGEFICPSLWCRLLNYNWFTCHFNYYLVGDIVLTENSGD